jgi:hypothetical protein
MSVYKNLQLCRQTLADEEKFLGVWERTLKILELENGDETQVEAVKVVKDICLSFWNEKSGVKAERWVFFGLKIVREVKEGELTTEEGDLDMESENLEAEPKTDEVKCTGEDLIFLTEI